MGNFVQNAEPLFQKTADFVRIVGPRLNKFRKLPFKSLLQCRCKVHLSR